MEMYEAKVIDGQMSLVDQDGNIIIDDYDASDKDLLFVFDEAEVL